MGKSTRRPPRLTTAVCRGIESGRDRYLTCDTMLVYSSTIAISSTIDPMPSATGSTVASKVQRRDSRYPRDDVSWPPRSFDTRRSLQSGESKHDTDLDDLPSVRWLGQRLRIQTETTAAYELSSSSVTAPAHLIPDNMVN